MFDYQCFDPVDFVRGETMAARESDGIDPELHLKVFAFNMHMRWLVSIAMLRSYSFFCNAAHHAIFSVAHAKWHLE